MTCTYTIKPVHKKSADIIKGIYGKDELTEVDRKLAATMAFIQFFTSEDPEFDRKKFYDMCMSGTIAEAT